MGFIMADEQEMAAFIIEGARSSRAKCKTCRRKIDKDTLRLGILIEGPYGQGYLWHHLRCAAKKQFEKVEEAYGLESWNNAKQPPQKVPDLEDLRKLKAADDEKKKERKTIPYTEPDPSGRAKCKHCEEPIEKGSMRIILGREVEFGGVVRVGPINVHPRCAAEAMLAPDCATPAEDLADGLRANSRDVTDAQLQAVLDESGAEG
jgi:hypothetical protein